MFNFAVYDSHALHTQIRVLHGDHSVINPACSTLLQQNVDWEVPQAAPSGCMYLRSELVQSLEDKFTTKQGLELELELEFLAGYETRYFFFLVSR